MAMSALTLSMMVLLTVATPVGAAPSARPTPDVELIPAFDRDRPIGKLQYDLDSVLASAEGVVPGEKSLDDAARRSTNVQTAAAPRWVCTIYASDPSRFANTVEGEGAQWCSGSGWWPQKIVVTLQRHRWWGWQNVNRVESSWAYIYFVHRDFIYNCSGTGTHTYRVVTDGYAEGGYYKASVQSENYLRRSC